MSIQLPDRLRRRLAEYGVAEADVAAAIEALAGRLVTEARRPHAGLGDPIAEAFGPTDEQARQARESAGHLTPEERREAETRAAFAALDLRPRADEGSPFEQLLARSMSGPRPPFPPTT